MLRSAGPGFPSDIKEYVLLRILGKGAFGLVYEATLLNRKTEHFAIKIIDKKKIAQLKGMSERVRNEVSIHHQLRHPNILELHHFFEDPEKVYLVMELCLAGELYQYLARRKKLLSEGEVRTFFREIVKGVDYLHQHGIIHRDLKLSNILLDDGAMRPKIADFGLAVRQNNPQFSEQRTLCGTPNYLAPYRVEILLKKSYGAAADLWSLGCILFTLLTGKPPFESAEIRATFEKVSKVEYSLPAWFSGPASDLVSRLIVMDPESRISTKEILAHPFLAESTGSPPTQRISPATSVPLCTSWLKPLKQQTRHGIFELLESGEIRVDFMVDPTLTVISKDGLKIRCFLKGAGADATPVESFNYPNLPLQKAKIYEYARKFVELLRSKTPRVIICTDGFKAFLMDNRPVPDFFLKYLHDERRKIEFTGATQTAVLFDGETRREIRNPSENSLDDPTLDGKSRLMLSDFLGRYKQAMATLRKVSSDQERGVLPFPFVLREAPQKEVGQTAMYQPTIPMMTLSNDTAAVADMYQRVPSAPKIPPVSPAKPDFFGSFAVAYRTFIPSVGWCLASSSDQFLMLFADGVSILVDGPQNVIAYDDGHKRPVWYEIRRDLPEFAKHRLTYFPRFIQKFKADGRSV